MVKEPVGSAILWMTPPAPGSLVPKMQRAEPQEDLGKAAAGNGRRQSGFPGGSDSKASSRNAGNPDSIPDLGRYPGEGNGNPFQYSCLENSMDGGAW